MPTLFHKLFMKVVSFKKILAGPMERTGVGPG